MERYWHPQSPTHRSPDLPQPSLTMLAQAMDQQRPMEPTPAQRFVIEQQQAMQLEQQQKQQQKQQQATSASPRPHITQQQPALAAPHGFSESSSTAVDTDLSSSKAPSTDSRMSMFESAASSSSSLEDTFQQPPQQQQSAVYAGADDDVGKNGDVGGDIWQDFQPEYSMVNESYLKAKTNIYTDLEQSLNLLQELETRFETSKHQFQSKIEKQYEAWSRQLDDQRHLLERRQRTLHEREPKKQITFQNKIKLNVGGDLFETSLTTLQRDPLSLLAMMFSGRHVLDPDQDGAYFIDRDPTHFRLVLNYLRDLRLAPSAIESPTVCQELLQEAQYYRIHGLVKLLEQTRL
ncbi:hypothetical protein BC940DRAFT_322451 [Gongronella butleri]|nr:hypothetical protein BC940DRAFT_322451 [Gongronella butleri]